MFSRTRFVQMIIAILVSTLIQPLAYAEGYGSGDYGTHQVRRAVPALKGAVISVRQVSLEVEGSNTSRVVGAGLGGAACLASTNSMQNWGLRGALSVACAAVGEGVARAVSGERRAAQEITLRMQDGSVLSVTQEARGEALQVGDEVYLLRGSDADRVVKAG